MHDFDHHIGDYTRDTVGLSMIEDGAYRRLLDQYYARELPLPNDRAEVYRMARATAAIERKAVDYVLGKYFDLRDDGWHQNRADLEIARFHGKSDQARSAAELRWERERNKSSNANAHAPASADGYANASKSHAIRNATRARPTLHPPPSTLHNPMNASRSVGLAPDDAPPEGKKPKVNGHDYTAEAASILLFLNEKAGKRFPPTATNIGIIVARLKEGFSPTEVRQVIALKVREWRSDAEMAKYLRPDTLFGKTKFSNYVGELVPPAGDADGV